MRAAPSVDYMMYPSPRLPPRPHSRRVPCAGSAPIALAIRNGEGRHEPHLRFRREARPAMPFIDDPNGTTAQRSAKPERASANCLSKEPPPAFRSSGLYSPPQKTSEIRRKNEATRRCSFPAGTALARSPEGGEIFRNRLVAATRRLLPDREGFSRDAEPPEISATPFCRAPNTSEEGKSLRRARPSLRKFRERLFRCPRDLRRIAKGFVHGAQILRNFCGDFHRPELRQEFRAKRGVTWHKPSPARAKRGVTRHKPTPARAKWGVTRHTLSPVRAIRRATRHTVSPGRAKCGATRHTVAPARAKPGVTRHKPAPARASWGATCTRGRRPALETMGCGHRGCRPPPACLELATRAACSLRKLYTRPRS
jgi:hypothetical protein